MINISLPGYDVLTDTDPRHFSLRSEDFQAMIRLQDSGNGTYAVPAALGASTVTIPHNLGYIPFFKVYGFWSCPRLGTEDRLYDATSWSFDYDIFTGGDNVELQNEVDSTNVYLRFWNATGIGDMSFTYYYFIGRDPI